MLTGGELVLSQDTTIDGDQNNDGGRGHAERRRRQRILRITGSGTDVTSRRPHPDQGQRREDGAVAAQSLGPAAACDDGMYRQQQQHSAATEDTAAGWRIYAGPGSRLTITGCSLTDNYGRPLWLWRWHCRHNATLVVRDSELHGNVG